MKTKLLILMLAFTLVGLNAWAGDSKIIVWQKDGSTTEILFNQMPEFLYDNGNVSLENGDTQLSWPLSSLEKFTFENVVPSDPSLPTDVKDVEKPKLDIAKGCAVYDLNGRLVKEMIRSLSELPKGTYILNDGSVTTKVVRK
jgi:hypothetical protein